MIHTNPFYSFLSMRSEMAAEGRELYFIILMHRRSKLQQSIIAFCVCSPFFINLEMGGGMLLTKFLIFFANDKSLYEIRLFFDAQSSNIYFCLEITCI